MINNERDKKKKLDDTALMEDEKMEEMDEEEMAEKEEGERAEAQEDDTG